MTDIAIHSTSQTDIDQDAVISQLFTEIQHLNEQMQQDQTDIDRLKAETRVISAHSERLLLQIEAQLDLLGKVA